MLKLIFKNLDSLKDFMYFVKRRIIDADFITVGKVLSVASFYKHVIINYPKEEFSAYPDDYGWTMNPFRDIDLSDSSALVLYFIEPERLNLVEWD